MVKDIRPLATGYTNVEWLNAIRNSLGSEYQARVPEATQANIQDVVQNLWNYSVGRNQFVDALINKIGLTIFAQTSWTNPLGIFKRGFLNWGETIEEIMVGLLKATAYDPNRDELEKEIFGRSKPEVQASYHSVNRRDRYKLTIDEPMLRQAFTASNGLSTFVTNLMTSIQTSDQYDEYLIMANLISEFDKAAGDQGIYNINVPDVGHEDSDGPASRRLLRAVRQMSAELGFVSRLYNPAGMPTAVNPNELVLITTTAANAAMDVEALAAAFNLDKAQMNARKIVLPQRDIGIPGFQAALTTDKFFVAADQRIETTSIQNPAALFNNYWLHHWGVYSASRFAPFIMLNSERESTEITLIDEPVTGVGTFTITDANGDVQATNVERNGLYDVAVSALTDGPNDAVRYELVGAESPFTRITNTGVLYVAPNESADTLTIQAFAVHTDIPQIVGETSRTVVGDLVNPWPNPEVLADADKDGVEEVVPQELTMDPDTKIVVIPHVTGVQYRKEGVNVNNGSEHEITAETDFDAVARSGFEIAAGADTTWTFTP